MERLHPRIIWVFFIGNFNRIIISIIVLVITVAFLLIFWPEGAVFIYKNTVEKAGGFVPFMKSIAELRLILLVVIIGWAYVWARLRYKFYKYELTENAFQSERGVLYKKQVFIPYERIQNVDIERRLLYRMLGLSLLSIQTAGGTGSSEGSLPGITPEKAEELRAEFIRRAKQTKEKI